MLVIKISDLSDLWLNAGQTSSRSLCLWVSLIDRILDPSSDRKASAWSNVRGHAQNRSTRLFCFHTLLSAKHVKFLDGSDPEVWDSHHLYYFLSIQSVAERDSSEVLFGFHLPCSIAHRHSAFLESCELLGNLKKVLLC